jgi:hypothetical protein
LHQAQAFERSSVEEFVLFDGAANLAAELIAVVCGLGKIADGMRTRRAHGIPVERKQAAVKRIGAALGGDTICALLPNSAGAALAITLNSATLSSEGI